MIALAARRGVPRVAVHAFLDGRDTPPRSAAASIERLEAACAAAGNAFVATICGRYFAMDRDKRWERVRPAYLAITEATANENAANAQAGLEAAYARGEGDEFVAPTVIGAGARVAEGDAVVFMNFRADRAREMSAAFVSPDFDGFERPRPLFLLLGRFSCLSEYDAKLPAPVAFGADDLHNTLAEVVAAHGLTQLRIAETEKYAHVTFFLSGGREELLAGEDRILVPSPKVATYDLQPEMSCPEVTAKLVADIRAQRHDLIVCNIANPDMVGHTGSLAAAIAAAEAVDVALGALHEALAAVGGEMIVTADHGNLEMMRDPATGQAHTAHTVGPVPLLYFGARDVRLRAGGALRDIAPTILELLQLPQPPEMTGHTLLEPR